MSPKIISAAASPVQCCNPMWCFSSNKLLFRIMPSSSKFYMDIFYGFILRQQFILTKKEVSSRLMPKVVVQMANDERIQTEADCRAALDVLAPSCSSSKWSGDIFGIPRCCSERPGHCGSSDWHWNSASTTSCITQVGSGRSDTAPICKRGGN